MNSQGTRFLRRSASNIIMCTLLAAIFSLPGTGAGAQQLGYYCGKNQARQDKWCIDPNQVVDIGAGEVRTHGNGDPRSEYNGDLLYNYGTINVGEGGLLKTNYSYYDNDKPQPGTNYLVVAQPLIVTNNASLIVQKGGRVLNEGTVWNSGYMANYGTWDNWFSLGQGSERDKDTDNLAPRFDNYGLINGMYKYSSITIRRGTFNNYGVINTSGSIGVSTENTGPDFYSNPPVDPTYFTNHIGAVINFHKGERTGGGANRGGTITNNGTITFHPETRFTNDAGGKFVNNNIVDNYGTFENRDYQSLYWHQGGTIPAFVPGSYFENNGTWHNRAGSVFTTSRMANVVNNGTFVNEGRFEFTSGHYTGYGAYPGRPQVNGNKPGYFINRGVFRNNGEVILKSAIHGNEYTIRPDGWSDMTRTQETGSGSMTNEGLITGKGSWSGLVINERNGTVAPGDSIGTMTIAGNYTSNPGSNLEIELDNKSSDKLIITGTATLNGGNVTPAYSGTFLKNMPYTYTFLTAAGGVNGTFTRLLNTSAFFDIYLSHFPTYVDMTLIRKGFDTICKTENQCAVAGGLENTYTDATGDMRDVFDAILKLSVPRARDAFDQMGGLIHTTIPAVTFSSFSQHRNMMTARMAGFLSGGPSSMLAIRLPLLATRTDTGNDAHNRLLAAAAVPAAGDGNKSLSWGFWTEGYGNLSERRAGDISSRYDHSTAGLIVGFDKKITSSLLLGGSLGYSYTRVDMKDLSEDAKISSYTGSLYGVWTKGPWYLNSIAGYSNNRYDTSRDMAFGTIWRSADASYNGHLLAGHIEGGYRLKMKYADIIPHISFQATRLWRDSFSEDGAGVLSLDADRETVSSYLGSLGVAMRRDYVTKAGILTPEIRLRWDHEFSNDDHALNASFTGYPSSAFTVSADRPDRDRFAAGLGLTFKTRANVYLGIYYDGYFSNDTSQHSGMFGLQYKW